MNREEVIDLAMDIFENTDATMEEAMGVAMENQMSKMKAEARKTGDWDKVIMRQGLKDTGKKVAARNAEYGAEQENKKWLATHGSFNNVMTQQINRLDRKYDDKNRPGPKDMPERFMGESDTKQYQSRLSERQQRFDKNKRQFDSYVNKSVDNHQRHADDARAAGIRVQRMGRYSESVPEYNGRGTMYDLAKRKRERASKEAAIMDTALDFLDMYDVSLEEAIDMAYDYLID